jgi:FG-GAP-like repeat/FG-GAP repeat
VSGDASALVYLFGQIMVRPTSWAILIVLSLGLFLAACGSGGNGSAGSGSTGGSGGGNGGGGGGPSISVLAPSTVPVGSELGIITIYGQGFTDTSQVLIDGQPGPVTLGTTSSTIQAQIDTSINATAGTHKFSIQNGSTLSNSLPYTIYSHPQGPFVMQATPGFLVSENENDAPFIVVADVNGDGLADVVMPGPDLQNSGSIAILNGQSDGTLSAAQYVPVPITPYALAVGDVDGNGTPDLVSITSDNASSTTVSILLGDGHGNFQSPVSQQTFAGIYPGPAYLSDLDGDGKLDLVLAVEQPTSIGGSVVWLKNTGAGFAAPVTLASIAVGNLQIADFNGDGKPDILYAVPNTGGFAQSLHILMNQGNGSFTDQAAGGLNGIVGFATLLDFNLDGIPDLIVQVQQTTGGVLYSFAGQGNGSFTQVASLNTPGVTQLVAGDFDHDGFPDLAGPAGFDPSQILYLFGDGHGNFTPKFFVGPEGEYVAVGDFNGDGLPDVVIPDRFNFVSLSLGRTDRDFPAPVALYPATMTGLSTGDINGDGYPDIFVAGNPMPPPISGTVFINQGGTSFNLAAYTDPTSFEIADLTGKGVVDLLGGDLEIWPNNGTPNFSSSPITLSQPTSEITVADMDGDGYPDIVSAFLYAQSPGQIFYGNGAYQFKPVTVASLSWPYVIGDFNGDGKPDIATGSGTLLNQGGRSFQLVTGNNLPLSEGALTVVGDFNGDGKDDVAINLPGDVTISIYYSNGDGTFYQGVQVDPGQSPAVLVAGDFNGDGKVDLAVGLEFSQQACILFNEGNGQFSRSFFASGADVAAMVSADLNRDGKPDLVIGNFVLNYEPANVNVVFHK